MVSLANFAIALGICWNHGPTSVRWWAERIPDVCGNGEPGCPSAPHSALHPTGFELPSLGL